MNEATLHKIDCPGLPGGWIETGFENSNPSDPGAIRTRRDGTVEIRQFLEPGARGDYAFHLHVALTNAAGAAAAVRLRIRWATRRHDDCYDHMYIGYDSGREWRMLATRCDRGVTDLELVVPPGRHLLCLHPKFDYADCLALVAKYAAHPLFRTADAAASQEGRRIPCIRCGTPGAPRVVVTTRAHPYETAGAFCMAGWLNALLADPGAAGNLLDRLELYFLPMINPDAVARGHCCLAPSGVNFGRELAARSGDDAGARGLADFILGLEPAFYLDMHNYTRPHFQDEFRTPSAELAAAFAAAAPDRAREQKRWKTTVVQPLDGYLSALCEKRFGTLPMLTEFPWYLRSPAEMMDHGRAFFTALLPLLA